ncbi:MAG: FAD:protein FMN transferase [Salinivirgaceae bacterium]|jgi:thiamine biosynthesis lipoprotein|nr:FAD:protein FMN transferase [Salinivirgaceae bacterium]
MNKISKFIIFTISIVLLVTCTKKKETYIKNEGFIFGTTYHFTYQSSENIELDIKEKLQKFNASLSTYDPNSIISRVNSNDSLARADSYFTACFSKANEISTITNGAFDMTVAPVVNAWGFGFDESTIADSANIDSLMQFVGFNKIRLSNGKIIKETKGVMLDASAIAKGYGVDIASELLESKGVTNYMVEIGGEVRAKGKNAKSLYWRIGIDKPIDDPTVSQRELQAIVSIENKSLATSGNYRQFYEKDGIKYSHTIDPRTGYPARNQLLSASVLGNDCMTADAFATAFMVIGLEKSIKLVNNLDYLEAYFIYTDSSKQYFIYETEGFHKITN